MAITYGEYGPIDDATGMPVWNAGGESGYNWMSVGNETVAPISYGTGTTPSLSPAALPDSSYITRGNYRLPNQGFGGTRMGGGQLEFRDTNGNWIPVNSSNAPAGYDPRQDSNTQGSNERLRFDQAFTNAPEGIPITDMQQWAMANGWQEPDRSNNEGTLGAMLSNVIPGALAVVGGVNALQGLGALGASGAASSGVGSINPALAESFAANYAPSAWAAPAGAAGTSGGSLADLMSGLGDTTADIAIGNTTGSGAMDFSNLGDLWDYGSTATEAGGASLEDMAIDLFNKAGTPGYTQYGDTATGLDWLKSQFGGPGSVTSNITKLLSGGTGGSGGNSTGSNASLLSGLAKLYSAYNSEGNLKDAIGANQGAIDRAVNWQDPNQPRGNEANRLWIENYTNPKAGYNEFMQGAGRDFTEQARAAAAKSGKRGSYLNSGKMQSDLASLWMKNQFSRGDSLAKGFTSPRNYAADALRDSLGLSDLYKQRGGSIGMAVGDILGSSQVRELISNITGSYW